MGAALEYREADVGRARDPVAGTEPARAAFIASFDAKVDPDGLLDPVERRRPSECLRKAHNQRLALASVRARRAKTDPRRDGVVGGSFEDA
ncbi:MAG: hypothetical protein H0V33_04430 [Acidimicrobiia bacterium]|nr:hypothetical protein [Acidimicrobiia bacterium]